MAYVHPFPATIGIELPAVNRISFKDEDIEQRNERKSSARKILSLSLRFKV